MSSSSPDIPGFTFGNVGAMTTCNVLRCQNPGSTVITGGQHLNDIHEAYICAEHNDAIEAGAHWDIPDGAVLMGQDVAPVLISWSVRDSVGTPGFTLTLEPAGQAKPFEVFLTPAAAKMLSPIFSSRGE